MKSIAFTFISFLFCLTLSAQNSVSGKLLGENEEAISYANVILNNATDSSMAKVELTGDDGSFIIPDVVDGQYWIEISYLGLEDYKSEVINLQGGTKKDLGIIQMLPGSEKLTEVVVQTTRPILEVKPDKLVFNVEGSVNATGSDGLELLRKAPGVVVDNNDNISLAGKSNVRIFIDGKPTQLSGDDLAAYLKSVNSNEIDNLEIITNPSAKYEAEGNAGIINIKMKKDKRLGANASVNLGYSQGRYGRYNGGFSGNYRNKLANLFGSYAYNDGNSLWFYNNTRFQLGDIYRQESETVTRRNGHNFKFGTDFFLNEKNTIGFLVNGNINKSDGMSDSRTDILTTSQNVVDSILVSRTETNSNRSNYGFNLNYQHDNKKEQTWNVDLDYGIFRNRSEDFQPNSYLNANESATLSKRDYLINSETDIGIFTFKLDYERPLGKGKLGVGAKTVLVNTDNLFDNFEVINNNPVRDIFRSSEFEYAENVNAIYGNYTQQIKKFGLQLGLRIEQTNSRGILTADIPTNNDDVKRNYIDFFPSGGLTYNANRNNSIQLNYSRRLDRPDYQNLNPFEYRQDEISFFAGNPFLRPQYTNNVQLSHTFKYMYVTSLGFSHTKDLMTRVSEIREGTNERVLSWINLTEQYNYNLTFSAPITFTKWWGSFTNLTAYHTYNKAEENGELENIDLKVYAARLYSQHTFTLPWDMKFELSGWYSSPSVWGGTFRTDAMFGIDAGLQKKFLDGKGNIRIGMSDIFNSQNWSGEGIYGVLRTESNGGWDSQRFKIDISYFFGNDKVKSRKRKTGLDEESKRTSGGGGGNGQ